MEFLRVVEEELRGLAAEARRRYPVVQEAAERAILKLRNMREEYVVALRQQHEGKAPPLSMFRSQDLLRPFLLACNHGDASPHLMAMAMGSIQYLINRDAILPSDAPNILRVLAIQSHSKDTDVQTKVLQTMMMVVSCDMTEDTISQAMGVCLALHDAENAMVRTAADLTVRQVITLLFDRVAEELGVTADQSAVAEAGVAVEEAVKERGTGTEGALRCARLVFQDLCILSRGEQGQWMKRTSITVTLGLELIEEVLSQQPVLFRRVEVLRRLLSQEVSPLILQTLRRRMEFPLLVRLLRTASTVCVGYGDLLPGEARSILSTLLTSLGAGVGSSMPLAGGDREGNGSIMFSEEHAEGTGTGEGGRVSWAAMLTVEVVHRVVTAPPVILELFRHGIGEGDKSVGGGDETKQTPETKRSIVEEMLLAVSRHLLKHLNNQPSIQALETMAQSIRLGRVADWSLSSGDKKEARRLPVPNSILAALARDAPPPENGSGSGGAGTPSSGSMVGSGSRGAMRSWSADLLHESDKPSLDDAELLLWSLQCTVDFSSTLLWLVETEFDVSDPGHVIPSSACLAPGEGGGAVLTESIRSVSKRELLRRICECLWEPVLSSLSHVMVQCSDPLLVSAVVDGYKAFLVVAAVLGVENAVDGFMGSLCRFSLPQWHGTSNAAVGGRGQGATTIALSWNHVGILQSILQITHRLGNLLRSSWHVVLDTLEQAVALLIRRAIARPKWTPHLPDTELAEVEQHCVEVLEATERLVQFSSCLEDEALYTLMSSLQALTVMGLANTATVLPQERNASKEIVQNPQSGSSVAGAGSAAVAAATGLVSLVGAAARGVGAAMSEGRNALNRESREKESRNQANAKSGTGGGDVRFQTPWVSSRLVVECAAANTWRLPVVWELVSGHLRVVAKARRPGTREYAVRALQELVVDGVQRLHPNLSRPASQRQLLITTTSPTTPQSSASRVRTDGVNPPPASQSGTTGAGSDEGFIPTLLGFRGRSGDFSGEEERFRWVFDADLSGVFVSMKREEGMEKGGLSGDSSDYPFEAVLFDTMGLFALTPHVDTREATLQTLYTILQSCGQVLESAWSIILNLLHSVAKGATDTSHSSSGTPSEGKEEDEEVEDDGLGVGRVFTWGGACLSLAFKCLQLIVDDFLERLPLEQVPQLMRCVGAFGGQTENVNLSLTAIGMLWTVCDTFADATSNHVGDQGTDKAVSPSIQENRPALHSMWPTMLFELRSLAVDFRPELRNCAMNTLFSAAVRNGSRLSEEEWKQFLLEVTFPLMHQVLESTNSASKGANTAVAPELKKGVRMLMHHTRDTDQKQWNETRVLAMQGLGRVLRAYVGHLARWEWFSNEGGVWAKSLQFYKDACLVGSDSQEVGLAGIDGITTLVLLVGRTGFNSVQVRAGAGMKIVDGTLQRAPAVSSRSTGGRKGTTAEAAAGSGVAMSMTPEFTRVRPVLYRAAWETMVEASKFYVDDNGDIAPAFVQGIAAVYKAGMEEGAEFCPGQEGEPKRAQEMFKVLDSLFLPRVPQDSQTVDPAPRRTVYLPKVTAGQRAILDFLQEDLRSGWRLALTLLAKYSIAAEDPREDLNGEGRVMMEGAENSAGVTVECRREATAALSAMMSDRLRVPPRERALAFEGLLSEVSGPCLRRLEALRRTLPSKSSKDAETAKEGGMTGAEDAMAALRWPSRDRCKEIMQLLLALLSNGLASISSEKDALQSQDSNREIKEGVECDGSSEAGLMRAYAVAVKAIGAVSECHQLSFREEPSTDAVRGDDKVKGFPQLLCEALSLVIDAVRVEVVPLVQQGREDAKDVARSLLDTLGVACSLDDVLCSSAITTVAPSRATDAYELAFAELLAMSGSKSFMSNGGDKAHGWERLGLPLRRRACWHLLRCVWKTSRYFRSMEDACSSSDCDDVISGGDDVIRGGDDYSNDVEDVARTLKSLALRCTRALWTIGQLRLPQGILTPRFKKLVADKQAEEAELPLVIRNPVVKLQATSDADLERLLAARKEEEDWAAMAEGHESDEADLQNTSGGEQLMLSCRVLLMCSASRTDSVRQEAAALLAEADIPGALNALQDEVASLKRQLCDRQAQLHRAEGQVASLRAQVAAGAFML